MSSFAVIVGGVLVVLGFILFGIKKFIYILIIGWILWYFFKNKIAS